MTTCTKPPEAHRHQKPLPVHRLLQWFRQNARSLPWRETYEPYFVLVSEFMLQQTQVKTALPYFRRFLRCFPTLKHLAQAPESEVLREWSGLGYYRRAKNLHAAARVIQEHHQGQIPSSPSLLISLPGIGPYTAAAIASIAYGVAAPAIDANVERILCRFYGLRLPKTKKDRDGMLALAQKLITRAKNPRA